MYKTDFTGIINYGLGNVKSVFNAVVKVGGHPILSSGINELSLCKRLVLPGVGAFPHAMELLHSLKLCEFIKSYAAEKNPILGICLGMQLFCQKSNEFSNTEGLGLMLGESHSFNDISRSESPRLPHVGWAKIKIKNYFDDPILTGLRSSDKFYFVHSYCLSAHNDHCLASSIYNNLEFSSVVKSGLVYGTQFHPEKSGRPGLMLLKNFITL